MTWADAWGVLNTDGNLVERPNQRELAEAVFDITTNGGILLGEAPVGCGKSFAYSTALISRVHKKERCVISTETTALQDQLVDRDLKFLNSKFGPFKYASLKGRSWYLCQRRASDQHWIIRALGAKDIGNGERRDVERVLGRTVSEDDWEAVSGDADYCAQNKCTGDSGCYSSAARTRAGNAAIVVTNHALLRTHAEMEEGILGDFDHLVVDEAHTLEKVLIDGWGEEVSPYELWKSLENIWTAIDASNSRTDDVVAKMQEAEHFLKEAVNSVVALHTALAERRTGEWLDDKMWRRETFTLSEQYLSGSVDVTLADKLTAYEIDGPTRFKVASENLEHVYDVLKKDLENRERGNRKVSKGKTAARRLARVMGMVAEAMTTRDGIIMQYGVPYVILGEGYKAYKGTNDVRIRCVPLDISARAHETIWAPLKSATLVSGTLRDETDGTFNYVIDSLGLKNPKQIKVGSGFDYAQNQLVYVTPGTYDPIDVVGARYSMEEMVNVIEASRGRALVLFTANAEMEYAADHLRQLYAGGLFDHRVLVQERGVSKPELARAFMEDKHSVLLASKSFFTGMDFPGESCSMVVLAKYPLPQWNALCRAQNDWWMKRRGFKYWYDREALQVFRQASGRLIRNETDRGVIAVLDNRVANPKERVSTLTQLGLQSSGSLYTSKIEDVSSFIG